MNIKAWVFLFENDIQTYILNLLFDIVTC